MYGEDNERQYGQKNCQFVIGIQEKKEELHYIGHLNLENPWVVRDLVEWEFQGYVISH